MKKYKIQYNEWDTNSIKTISLSIKDLRDFFISSRGFPSILRIGNLMGEGQSGGRFILSIAKKLELAIIDDIREEEYIKQMNKLMED